MGNGRGGWLDLAVPSGWKDVLVRTVLTGVVAFVALLLKEYFETREWDVPACAVDGTCVAGGIFLLNAILRISAPRGS